MEKPTEKQRRGLEVLVPVLDAMLDAPSTNDFQHCTPREIEQAAAALAWIRSVAFARKRSERF